MEPKNPIKDPLGAASMLGMFILMSIIGAAVLALGLSLAQPFVPAVVAWIKKPFQALVA